MTFLDEAKDFQMKAVELQKQAKSKGIEEIQLLFRNLLAKYPQVAAFRWKQYTPGFCDGDPCEFEMTLDSPEIKLHLEEDFSDDGQGCDKLEKELRQLQHTIGMEVFNWIFGDGVEITVIRTVDNECTIEIHGYDCEY